MKKLNFVFAFYLAAIFTTNLYSQCEINKDYSIRAFTHDCSIFFRVGPIYEDICNATCCPSGVNSVEVQYRVVVLDAFNSTVKFWSNFEEALTNQNCQFIQDFEFTSGDLGGDLKPGDVVIFTFNHIEINTCQFDNGAWVDAKRAFTEISADFANCFTTDTPSTSSRLTNSNKEIQLASLSKEVLVFPTPFTNDFQIQLSSPQKESFQLSVWNLQGKGLLNKNGTLSKGFNQLSIQQLSDIPSGIYQYELITDSRKFDGKIIKK